MAKYRLLSLDELGELEKEFIEYLILNGLTAEDWKKLKGTDDEKASEIIHLFSDVVFEGIFRKVNYMEHREANRLVAFQCLEQKLVSVIIEAPSNVAVDFTDTNFMRNAVNNPPNGLKISSSHKEYSKPRELELFEITLNGGVISDGKLFKALCLAL